MDKCMNNKDEFFEIQVINPYLENPGGLSGADALQAIYSEDGFREVILKRAKRAGRDWNRIAHEATGMYLTGKYSQKEIAEHFGVSLNTLREYVDLKAIRMMLLGDAATKAFEKAQDGDNDMIKFVLDRQGGWNDKKEIHHSGEIGLRPILNIGVKQLPGVTDEENTSDV